jgi:hypothetical protein
MQRLCLIFLNSTFYAGAREMPNAEKLSFHRFKKQVLFCARIESDGNLPGRSI